MSRPTRQPWPEPKTCDPPQYEGFYWEPLPKRQRTLPEWHPNERDIPVRTLRDPRRRPPTLQEQIIQRRNSRAAAAANYGPSIDAPLTDREKSEGGGCLMFLLCVAVALGLYVSDTSVSVEVHKKPTPKTIHKE